jgi:hypothetical protein
MRTNTSKDLLGLAGDMTSRDANKHIQKSARFISAGAPCSREVKEYTDANIEKSTTFHTVVGE